jgi:Amidase
MSMPGDLLSRPLIEIARDLREKRATARELIEAAIARHERFGERLHAYLHWAPQQARAVAEAADAAFAAGVTVGPLQGLPISIKDLFAAAGYPCFAGSSLRLPADPWERDGPLVARLRRQLGVIMGKTHMVEFAFGGAGHNMHWGAPYNPWDATAHRSVGGSSSGAGVSLLEGSAALALGSDTAGYPGQVARARLRDKAGRIDLPRIKRGKPKDHVRDAARQQSRGVEGERSCRPTSILGFSTTTSSDPIKAAGASARPRWRPSLTPSLWQRRRSWQRDHRRQLHWTQSANNVCQTKSRLLQVRHRQSKGAATDMFGLRPPRHTSTLPT